MKRTVQVRTDIRKTRIRVKQGSDRPRLCVYRSNRYISAQVIDPKNGKTLVSCHERELGASLSKDKRKQERAFLVGQMIGKKAAERKIRTVVFDRSGYLYHGRVAELARGAREAGLQF